MRYVYLGDRLTDPVLRGALCVGVRGANGKAITGRSAMLVRFDGEDSPRVVLRRMLRKSRVPTTCVPTTCVPRVPGGSTTGQPFAAGRNA